MAKKIPSASINITSALRSILTQSDVKRSVVDQNQLINSKIRVTGGAFAAASNALSPIDHVAISYAGSTFRVSASDIISAITDTLRINMTWGIRAHDYVNNADSIKSFGFNKSLRDFANTSESIKISMGYTRTLADTFASSDRSHIGSSKVLATVTDPIDSVSRGFVKHAADIASTSSAITSFTTVKRLSDFVIPLDYMTITDGSTFVDVKVIHDYQPVTETLARTVSYNRAYQDAQPVVDTPHKGLFKSFADEVSVFDFEEHNKRLLEDATDAFTTIDASTVGFSKTVADSVIPLDYMTIDDGSTFEDIKALSDSVSVVETRSADYTKPLREVFNGIEGPRRGLPSDFSVDYFLDDYTEDLRPVWNLSKVLSDSVIPLDYMTITDGSTFEDVKVLSDAFTVSDVYASTISFIRSYSDSISSSDHRVNITINKSLRDTAVALDYMTIADGSTFQDVKPLYDSNPVTDRFTSVLIFGRSAIEILTAPDHDTITFTKPFRETMDVSKDGDGHDTYAFDYFLDGSDSYYYANRWLPLINFTKSVHDSVIPLDLMTISDGSTFEDIKRLYETVTTTEHIPLEFTKGTIREIANHIEGPGFGSEDDFSLDYFLDDYTTDPRPVWTIYKPFIEPVLVASDTFLLVYEPNRVIREILSVSDAGGDTFDLTKRFFDTVGTIDETTITDGGLYELYKTFSETLRAIEGPATRVLEDYVNPDWTDPTYIEDHIPVYTFVKPLSDSVIPLDYMTIADGSTFEDVKALFETVSVSDAGGDTYTLSKPLFETKKPVEGPAYGDINDYSFGYFLDEYTEDFKPIWTIHKPFADSVIPLDYMTIADGSTFEDVKPLPPEFLNVSAYDVWSFNKAKAEVLSVEDAGGDVFDLHKAIAETKHAVEGPAYHDYTWYAVDYFDDPYSEWFGSIFSFNKVLPTDLQPQFDSATVVLYPAPWRDYVSTSDFGSVFDLNKGINDSASTEDYGTLFTLTKVLADSVIPLDYMTITDGSTFTDIKVIGPDFVGTLDNGNVFDLNKGLASSVSNEDYGTLFTLEKVLGDSVRPKEGPTTYNGDDYVPDWTDPAYLDDGRPIYNIIKVLPTDYATALDYMTIADGSTFQDVKVLSSILTGISDDGNTFDLNKGLASSVSNEDYGTLYEINLVKRDSVTEAQGPVYYDHTKYSSDYFADNYAEYFNISYTFIKVLPTDYAVALDYMTIADGSTFEDNKVLAPDFVNNISDLAATHPTKVLSSSNTGTSDLLLPFTFVKGLSDFVNALDLIRIAQPLRPDRDNPQTVSQIDDDIYNFNKVLADSAIPLDYMTIDDGSTFTDIKPLHDIIDSPFDGSGHDTYAANYFESEYDYTLHLIPIFEFDKVLHDSVIPLDYMTISDGSTFEDIKVLATFNGTSDTISNISATKVLMSEQPGIEDNGNVFNFNKVLADFQLTRQGPSENSADQYVPDWADPSYIDDGDAIFTLIKVFTDAVIPLDYMTITDGSTFEDVKVLSDTVSEVSDFGNIFDIQKPVNEYMTEAEGPRRGLPSDFSPDYFLDDYTEDLRPIWTIHKPFADSVIPLDYMTIADGSTFEDVKVIAPEYLTADSFSSWDWLKTKTETLVAADVLLPFMVELAKFDSVAPPQGPVYYDYTQYSGDYFADNYAEYYNLKWEFSKVLTDSVIPLDYMTIEDGSTFTDVKVLATYQSAPLDATAVGSIKPLSSSNTGTSDLLLPFNFTKGINDFVLALDLIRIQQPLRPDRDNPQTVSQIDDDIYNFNKVLASSAIPLDYMTIDDGSTFSEVKPLYDFVDAPISGSGRDNYALNYFDDPYFYAFRLVPIFEFNKVLADTVIPLDYMTISDGSTFAEIKVLATYQSAPIDRISNIAATKVLMSEQPGVEDNGNVFNFNKVLADFQLTRQGPSVNTADEYVPDWADPSYIDDGDAIFTLSKILSDSVQTLDYMTIADGSTFEDIKVLSSAVSTADNGNVYSLTKPLSDTYSKFEGPRHELPNDFAPDYFLDDYTENFGPIWTLSKAIADSVIPLDYMTIADGSTFEDIKPLPPEFIEISSFSSWNWTKTKVETLVASDVFFPLILNLVKRESVSEPQGPVYYDYTKYSAGYFADDYTEYYNLKWEFSKVLSDSAIALDYMTIADGSTFAEVKILSSTVTDISDNGNVFNFNKVLASSATALDYMTISDGSTFAEVKVLSSTQNTLDRTTRNSNKVLSSRISDISDNGNVFNLTKVLSSVAIPLDYMTIADGSTFSDVKILRDTVTETQGPVYYDKAGYAPQFFNDDYTEFFGPKYTLIKVLSDTVIPLDYMTIADGSTFSEVKVLSSTQSAPLDNASRSTGKVLSSSNVSNLDHTVNSFTKARADLQQALNGVPVFTLTKVLTSSSIALDYMTIADGSTFADTKPLPPDYVDNISDTAHVTPTKGLHSTNVAPTDLLLPFTFIKSIADTVVASEELSALYYPGRRFSSPDLTVSMAGVLNRHNYTSEIFFSQDFVGENTSLS